MNKIQQLREMDEIYPPEQAHLHNQLIKLIDRQWNAYDNLNHLPHLPTIMTDHSPTRKSTFQTIDGVEALINLDPGELFLDLLANTPRYIRVQEGDQIQEGDLRT